MRIAIAAVITALAVAASASAFDLFNESESAPSSAVKREVPTSSTQMQLSFSPIVKKVAPAVVNIYTKRTVKVRNPLSPLMNDPFFRQFFEGRGLNNRPREKTVSSLGSGVIVSADGLLVTSHHVVAGSEEVMAVLSDGNEYKAFPILEDEASDLAVLQLADRKKAYPHVPLVDSDKLEVGDIVLALGNPFGVGQTVTSGIISALARSAVGVSDYEFFIQTDAAINPGNSGGALVNMAGQLIGINTAIYSKSGGSQGIGFAIPSNMVAAVLRAASKGERSIMKPWLGASYQDVTAEIAESLGHSTPSGALVSKIYDNSPAARSNLKVGDVILRFDGEPIETVRELLFRVTITPLDKQVNMEVLRNSKKVTIPLTLSLPPNTPAPDNQTIKGNNPLSGYEVANLSVRMAIESGLGIEERGVVIVDGANPYGFRKGDIIVKVNGQEVTSAKQLATLMTKASRRWDIVYKRDGQLARLQIR